MEVYNNKLTNLRLGKIYPVNLQTPRNHCWRRTNRAALVRDTRIQCAIIARNCNLLVGNKRGTGDQIDRNPRSVLEPLLYRLGHSQTSLAPIMRILYFFDHDVNQKAFGLVPLIRERS
jgi:hypothetical protein